MIDHVSIQVADLDASAAFYRAVLAPLGLRELVRRQATVGYGKKYPEFWLNLRAGSMPSARSGAHVALRAPSAEAVQAFHRASLERGATDAGAPERRPEYTLTYYAAFVVDPDGNRIEAVTFLSER